MEVCFNHRIAVSVKNKSQWIHFTKIDQYISIIVCTSLCHVRYCISNRVQGVNLINPAMLDLHHQFLGIFIP